MQQTLADKRTEGKGRGEKDQKAIIVDIETCKAIVLGECNKSEKGRPSAGEKESREGE